MRLHLIRHGQAESRRDWRGPDRGRPLTKKGRRQARALAERDWGPPGQVGRVISSPYLRCVQTVAPAAERLGLEVTTDDRLAEGLYSADPTELLDWLAGLGPADSLICSHGDVLPELMRLMSLRGMTLDGPMACKKASTWTVEFDDEGPVHAGYTPPPSL